MRIDVLGRNLDVTDAIRQFAEQKVSKLTKFYDQIQSITVRVARADHQHRGNFDVELVVDVEHHADFVAHAKGEDLYAEIDSAVQKMSRQLSDFKERLKLEKRTNPPSALP